MQDLIDLDTLVVDNCVSEVRVKTIVHDIKGVAHGQLMAIKMLKLAIEHNKPEKIATYLEILETETKLLSSQIGEILESDFETPQKINLVKWLAEIIEPYNTEEEFIQLNTQGKMAVVLEEKLMRLTIQELITNAIRYSPPQSEVKIDVVNSEDLVIVISNTCPNFNPELLKTLFKERCKNEEESSSSGFGLLQLRKRIKKVGGTITASHMNNLVSFTLKFIK